MFIIRDMKEEVSPQACLLLGIWRRKSAQKHVYYYGYEGGSQPSSMSIIRDMEEEVSSPVQKQLPDDQQSNIQGVYKKENPLEIFLKEIFIPCYIIGQKLYSPFPHSPGNKH